MTGIEPRNLRVYGELVREKRLSHEPRMSQQQLADAVGVDRTHISKIETGAIRMPDEELVETINRVLEINPDEFLDARIGRPRSAPATTAEPRLVSLGQIIDMVVGTLPPEQQQKIQRAMSEAFPAGWESVIYQEGPPSQEWWDEREGRDKRVLVVGGEIDDGPEPPTTEDVPESPGKEGGREGIA